MLKLLTVLIGFDGVRVEDLMDSDGVPVFFQGNDEVPVRLLHLAESAEPRVVLQRVNRAIELAMGVSLADVFAGDRFTFDNWAWFGFFVQPLFRLVDMPVTHPHAIVQVSCHVQTPSVVAQQSACFSPWLVYDPSNTAATGPRLIKLNASAPRLLHVFGSEAVGSGNQLMVALQHFNNSKLLRVKPAMEMHWVRVMTLHKHLDNNLAFVAPALETSFLSNPIGHGTASVRCTLTCPIDINTTSILEPSSNARLGSKIIRMIPQLPQEIVRKIYRMIGSASPLFCNVIPMIWWNTPKQSLYFACADCPFESYMYLKNPVEGLTGETGVLHLPYQSDILSFFREISFSVDDWSAPLDEWPQDALPRSQNFILPGQLFLVCFKFKTSIPRGFSLTIQPSPYVFRIHLVKRDEGKFGFYMP